MTHGLRTTALRHGNRIAATLKFSRLVFVDKKENRKATVRRTEREDCSAQVPNVNVIRRGDTDKT